MFVTFLVFSYLNLCLHKQYISLVSLPQDSYMALKYSNEFMFVLLISVCAKYFHYFSFIVEVTIVYSSLHDSLHLCCI